MKMVDAFYILHKQMPVYINLEVIYYTLTEV